VKPRFIYIIVILALLAVPLTSAFQKPAVTQIQLLSVSYLKEKGVTFKFMIDGDFKKNDLKGTVNVAEKKFRLYCNYFGDAAPTVVVCTSDKGTAKYAGKSGYVTIAGRSFWFKVPARIN
jgi:hypothetical protein